MRDQIKFFGLLVVVFCYCRWSLKAILFLGILGENLRRFFRILILGGRVLRRRSLLYEFLRQRFRDFRRLGLLFFYLSRGMRLVRELLSLLSSFCSVGRLNCRSIFLGICDIRRLLRVRRLLNYRVCFLCRWRCIVASRK